MCSSNTNKWVRERKRSTHSTAKPRPNRACSLILNIVPDDLPACSVATLTMWGESRWLGGMHTQNASRLQRKNPMSFLAFSLSSSLFVCVLWAQGSWILLGIYPDWLYWESLYAFWTGCLSLRLWKQLPSLRVFSGHWVMQNYLLAMAGCPVIFQTDCGKADWKLAVACLADLLCVSWQRAQLLPKRSQQES